MPLSARQLDTARSILNATVTRGGKKQELYGVEFEVEGSGVGLQDLLKKSKKDVPVYNWEIDPIPPVLLEDCRNDELIARRVMRDRIRAGISYDGRRNIEVPGNAKNYGAWVRHEDGSLRGESCEWVLDVPLTYNKTVEAIEHLFKGFSENGTKFDNSYRTSTHIHVNYQNKTGLNVFNIFVVHTVLEKLLGRYCGEDRDGNLFAIYARDAERLINGMYSAIFNGEGMRSFGNNQRYAALNLSSLHKFGSVEFRLMGGLDNAKEALIWLSMVKEMVTYADNLKDATSLFEYISFNGAERLVTDIFSKDNAERLLSVMSSEELLRSFYDGLREVQPLAYNVSEAINYQPKDEWGPVAVDGESGLERAIRLAQEMQAINPFPQAPAPPPLNWEPVRVRAGGPAIRIEPVEEAEDDLEEFELEFDDDEDF